MIKFFRQIRYKLMQENKTSRYFKYAIGEIILVMIGILLALQVNNWNQNRLEQQEEKEVIAKLHTEFKENKRLLEAYLINNQSEMNALQALMKLVGSTEEELNKHNLDSLLGISLNANDIAFADNTLKNIMQSGKLNLLKDERITTLLYQWNALAEIRTSRFNKLDQWSSDAFTPYLIDKISFKEMDGIYSFEWTGISKLKPNYESLFQELEFENHLDNMLWYQHQITERCEETNTLIDQIIIATKPTTR